MRTQTFFLVVLAFAVSCKSSNRESSVSKTKEIYERYQGVIDSIYKVNPATNGIMVHIEVPQQCISWSGCVGYSDKKEKTALTPDEPALIASSIKPYVAATILRLVEREELNIDDPIGNYLTEKTIKLFESDGYDLDSIRIKHLLAHRSGIYNYANQEYLNMIDNDRQHRWTRDEQLALSIQMGERLGPPADTFVYADANFLLATEIIETVYEAPFYLAMRELLHYESQGLVHTWFPTLEKPNPDTKPLVHQYWSSRGWDSHEIDPSFDLYGGGGIATTTKELALFYYNLFNGYIIKDRSVLNQIFTKVFPADKNDNGYCLGIVETYSDGHKSYGHGGFWGTRVEYFPEYDASISLYVLDRDMGLLRRDIIDSLAKEL